MAKLQPPVSSKDRASRFIWEPGQITIIRIGDEEAPATDVKSDKAGPDTETIHLGENLDDQKQTGKS